VVFQDNQSTIKIANNPVLVGRTKHMDVRYHFVREAIENQVVTLSWMHTSCLPADILTKAVASEKYRNYLNDFHSCALMNEH
jgi:uncharacterized beta-barrel protein YwiB (DUF1934 family)